MPPISVTTAYRAAGAEVLADAAALWAASDIVLKVRPPSSDEVALMREGGTLIGFIWPAQNPALMQQLAPTQGHGAGHRLPAAHPEPRAERWTR
jgi:NAD/NADP transhydrogenase alpha subunit